MMSKNEKSKIAKSKDTKNDSNPNSHPDPNAHKTRVGYLKQDDIQHGIPRVVKLLTNGVGASKNSYFLEQIIIAFADEISQYDVIPVQVDSIHCIRSFVDHANLTLYVLCPTIEDVKQKEALRHELNRDYTMGLDDLKTRAAISAYISLTPEEKEKLRRQEINDPSET